MQGAEQNGLASLAACQPQRARPTLLLANQASSSATRTLSSMSSSMGPYLRSGGQAAGLW